MVGLSACESASHRITGTDIPGVHGLKLVSSYDVRQSGRHIAFGVFQFEGPIYDALERVRWSARGFRRDEWKTESISGNPNSASGIFTQAWKSPERHRVARLEVTADRVHGVAELTVTLEKVTGEIEEAPSEP